MTKENKKEKNSTEGGRITTRSQKNQKAQNAASEVIPEKTKKKSRKVKEEKPKKKVFLNGQVKLAESSENSPGKTANQQLSEYLSFFFKRNVGQEKLEFYSDLSMQIEANSKFEAIIQNLASAGSLLD